MSTWNKRANKERETPKFLQKGTKVLVLPTEPTEALVEGKFGKQRMYIIQTKEYGAVYVSAKQFIHIDQVFDSNYNSAVTVEL